jgi:hypothetical protein
MGNLWEEGSVSLYETMLQFSGKGICQQAIQDAKTMSPLVQQCQKAVNDIFTWHTVGLYQVPGHAGVQRRGNEITNKLTTDGSVQKYVGPEPSFGVSMQNIERKIKR